MTTISDILQGNRILTTYENSILLSMNFTVITIIGLLLLITCTLVNGGIYETITLFTDIDNGVTIVLICWILYLIGLFMRGYLYIQRMNEAIYHGMRSEDMHFKGKIIKKIKSRILTPTKIRHTRFLVQLDNSKIVKTPKYVYVPYGYVECDVYFYKKKYYFTNFRRCTEYPRRWWNKDE